MASILSPQLGSPELDRAPLSAVFWGLGAGERLNLRMHSRGTQESVDWTLTLWWVWGSWAALSPADPLTGLLSPGLKSCKLGVHGVRSGAPPQEQVLEWLSRAAPLCVVTCC